MLIKKLLLFLKPNILKIMTFFILLLLSTIVAFGGINPDYGQGTFAMPVVLRILIYIFFGPMFIISKYTEALESLGIFQLIFLNSIYTYILSCLVYSVIFWAQNIIKNRVTKINDKTKPTM